MKETIKDFYGKTLGYIEIDFSGNKTVKDFYGRILGYYKASSNTTTLFSGKIIAYGDVTGIFFKDILRY